jgi:AcrR family transcriptional regulator
MATGLRERRKQEARQAISGVAMAMFAAKGFDEVTISQVADAAGVSKMTVTNYFPRKEDLVFDRAEVIIGSLAAAAAARAPGDSLLVAIRRDYADRLAAGDAVPTAPFAQMVRSSHVLTSRAREIADLREQALADAIAAETGTDDPQQRIVAAQLASVHRVLFGEGTRRSLAGQPRDEIYQVLTAAASRAFDLLEPSLGDYGVRGGLRGGGGLVEVSAMKRGSERRPVRTPAENSIGMIVSRSATPWRAVVTSSESSVLSRSNQGAWSLPSVWTDPSARPAHSAWMSSASRNGEHRCTGRPRAP